MTPQEKFDACIPADIRDDVMQRIEETVSECAEHEGVTIFERDRLDAINVRASGAVVVWDTEYTFIVESGNRAGFVIEDWDSDKVFHPVRRTEWALQPQRYLIQDAIIAGKGADLVFKWDAMLKNKAEIADIPRKYSYDRYVQPGLVVERHWKAKAAEWKFDIVSKEEADETRAKLLLATKEQG